MASTSSVTRIENELAHAFRNRIKGAEGAADVQKIFAAFVRDMLGRLTGAEVVLDEGDVRVDPALPEGYALGPGIAQNPDFALFFSGTDLPDALRRQGQDAANKLRRLGKGSERDEAKIFPRQSRRG